MATTPEPHKIPIQKYSVWNKEVKADWWAILRGLTKMGAGAGATMMDPATGFSSVIQGIFDGAVDIGSAFKAEDKIGHRAYKLIFLSFSMALKDLLDDEEARLSPYDAGKHQEVLDKLNLTLEGQEIPPELNRLERKVLALEEKTLQIGKNFFKDPAGLSIISDFRPLFVRWIQETHKLPEHVANSVYNRFPRLFTFELHRQWKKHEDYFKPLLEELESPFYDALEKEIQRIQYDEWLKSLPFEPLLDEPFSVNDIYIPLRAYWIERVKRVSYQEEKEYVRVEDAETHFFSWLQDKESKNKAFVVQGGPGSGKSIFSKRIVAKATKRGMRCYFIPLHRLDTHDGSTEEKILKYISRINKPSLRENPFDFRSSDGQVDCLFVLDGLDEISKAGKASEEAAKKFIIDFLGLIDNRAYYGSSRVFITGRDLVIQQNNPEFKGRGKVVKLAPFFTKPLLPKLKSERLNSFSTDEEEKLFNQDQRDAWWKLYSFYKNGEKSGLPEKIQDTTSDELIELSSEPLLSYLLARSLDSKLNLETTQQNINLVYKQLVKDVYERVHGKNALSPQYQHLKIDFDDYLELMEEVAMAAWMSGDSRTVSYADTLKRCSEYGLDSTLARFEGNNEKGLFSLLISFFFHRPAKENKERTFEFTHKTFGEYLAARRIVRFGLEQVNNLQKGTKERNGMAEPYGHEDFLYDWLSFCGDTEISESIMEFLWRELALHWKDEEKEFRGELVGIQDTLEDMFNYLLKNSWPIPQGITRVSEVTRITRNAEITLLLFLSGVVRQTQKVAQFKWENEYSAGQWLARLCPHGGGGDPAVKGLPYLDFGRQNLVNLNLHDSRLSGARLSGARLDGAILDGAILNDAILDGAILNDAILDGASLHGARLDGASLHGARLDRASLDGAILHGASLHGASLYGASLYGAILDGAILNNARLDGASLKGASLKGASLDGARLSSETRIPKYQLGKFKCSHAFVNNERLEGQALQDFLQSIVQSIAVEDDFLFEFNFLAQS